MLCGDRSCCGEGEGMRDLEKFKEKISRCDKRDIVFASHSKVRALFRDIDLKEDVGSV